MQLFAGIKDKLKEYIDTRLQLYQITIEEKVTTIASALGYLLIITLVIIITLIFFLLFLAKILNHVFDNDLVGYGVVVGICALICVFLLKSKTQKQIEDKIKKRIILTHKNNSNGL